MSEMLTEPRPVFDSLIGRSATRRHVVGPRDLATAWDNDVEVLATPVLLWLSEVTAMDVLGDHLTEGWMTVGPNCFILSKVQAGRHVNIAYMLGEQTRHLAHIV
ncbi:hypothetical protein ABT329_33035, partial [Streptomyces minutiscleroticus]